MAKVVVGTLKKAKGRSGASIATKRVRNTEGEIKTLRTIDAASRTFGRDLHYVFGRNVAKARRENKKVTGANEGVRKG